MTNPLGILSLFAALTYQMGLQYPLQYYIILKDDPFVRRMNALIYKGALFTANYMKLFNQLAIILAFWLLGELLGKLLSPYIQIPGAIMGMVLLAIALTTGLLKESAIKETSDLLLNNISFFFVPASVGILALTGITNLVLFKIILITLVSTVTTLFVTMWVTNKLIKKEVHK